MAEESMNSIWPVAGALFGATMGLFVARSFTERWYVHLSAAMACAMLGIVLAVALRRRS